MLPPGELDWICNKVADDLAELIDLTLRPG